MDVTREETFGPLKYLNSITAPKEQVMQAIALSLGCEQHCFDEFCTDPVVFISY